MQVCDTCGGEMQHRWSEIKEEAVMESTRSREALKEAIEYFQEVPLWEGEEPLFDEEELTQILDVEDALELLHRVNKLFSLAELQLEHGEWCSECSGPVEELYTRDGVSRGMFVSRAGEEVLEAGRELYQFRARPTFKDPDDAKRYQHDLETYGKEKDSEAPFFSEAYLYVLCGKDHARSVLSAPRALLAAMGAYWRHLR